MKYTRENLEPAVKQSYSYANVLRILGKKPAGGTQTHIKKCIDKLKIDTSHFTGQGHLKGKSPSNKKTPEEILILKEDSIYVGRTHGSLLTRALLESGIEYKCEYCEISEWQWKPITLHVDHINGRNFDDRKENLRFLCPNCHSQTKTYGSKNNKQQN